MPVEPREMMQLVMTISEIKDMQVTVKESIKGGIIAGTGAVIGGIILGPIGLAVGSVVGGITAASMSWNKFQSAVIVIQNLNPNQQQQLSDSIHQIISNLDITDLAMLTHIVMGDIQLQKQIAGIVINYFRNELRMEIVD